MKLFATFVSDKRLFLFISICALVVIQTGNGMMPSKKHQAIAFNTAQVTRAKSMKAPVWVKTNDNYVVPIEEWKIDQMKVLQVMVAHQKGSNNQSNPIEAHFIAFNELQLLSDALNAASQGQFEQFYTNIGDADNIRQLINVAGKVEATSLSALCGTYFFPKEMQLLIGVDLVRPVVEHIRINIKPKSLAGLMKRCASVAFSPDGKKIVLGSRGIKNNLLVCDVETHEELFNLVGHNRSVHSVVFSPDGKKIVSGGFGSSNNLFVWDAETGLQLYNLQGHSLSVHLVMFSSDGKKIVSFSNDNVLVWNAETGDQLSNLETHQVSVSSAAFSPDGKKIVLGGGGKQGNLLLCDAETGELLFNLVGHGGSVDSVAFSPDGTKIVSGSWDSQNNLLVWNSKNCQQLFNLKGHTGAVQSVAFSPDGETIVSGSHGSKNNLMAWNVKDGSRLLNLAGWRKDIALVVFTPDGKNIVTVGQLAEDNLLLWELPIALLKIIENDLNIAHMRLLYQMYCAAKSGMSMTINKDSFQYSAYQTFPYELKKAVVDIFGVKVEGNPFFKT